MVINLKISRRLNFIINEIENDSIADIGTDHAYVPIAAFLRGKIKKAIATDIRRGPLDIAQKNILSFGLQNFIQTRLSDGFKNILPGEVKTGIISGIGGFIICDIISHENLSGIDQLILQPQNNFYYVRKKLHCVGFKIVNEIFLYQQKFYNIINARRGYDIFYDEKDYAVGKILLEQKNPLLKKFLTLQIKKLSRIKNFNCDVQKFYDLYLEALQCFAHK